MATARLRRDTAKRSIDEFFKDLPPEATVEVTKTGPPPSGASLAVKLEISAPPAEGAEVRTSAPARRKPRPGKERPGARV